MHPDKALGENSLRDQVYWNPQERCFRVIHRGVATDRTFNDDREACRYLAGLRADALIKGAIDDVRRRHHV
jgi:hypothetical protein